MLNNWLKYILAILPPKISIQLRYYYKFHKFVNFKLPKTFTEKIQWLKLYNYRPEYTKMVDKYAVKEYVSKIIGKEYIIPTLGVWDKPEDIEWDKLPDKFVLKTTHAGGGTGVIICSDAKTFNRAEAIKKLTESLKIDTYSISKERPYKNVPRRIIAEQFLESTPKAKDIPDYKFFCFNGKVKFFKVDFGRFTEHHANYYSPIGELLEFGEVGLEPNPNYKIELPHNLHKMISIAETLSKNEPFIRVDLYSIKDTIYFGELTFYPASGMGAFTDEKSDYMIGDMLELPVSNHYQKYKTKI